MSAPKILVVITSHSTLLGEEHKGKKTGWYLPELAHPYYEFKRAGFELVAASPAGGEVPLDESSVQMFKEDPESKQFLEDAEAQQFVKTTKKLSEIDPKGAGFAAIFYPGGHGPCFDLPVDEHSQTLIREFYESGRPTSAVCHAPAVLVNVKLSDGSYLLNGRKATGFTNEEEEQVKMTNSIPWLVETTMKERGAIFEKTQAWGEKIVVDTNNGRTLVTGQNPSSAGALAKELVKLIKA